APIQAENNTAMPAAFLMQQMQWREALEEAGDGPQLEALHDEVAQALRAALEQCQQLLDQAHNYPAAAQQVRALMFIERFSRDVRDHLNRIADRQ
ncbi:iron-sulfur cluster co-chaperone HscB C-terminal domain-containing protein, partial [Rhodoferax sp.]|uniref:iron-sulfur cluster co-chaperone HscB C-terminal domain-containing protein n=1 Tax=Rhodoferax sp. TaxID=50421 RepID=UPI0027434A1B|nr:iron-sulfur cluster co-chaperone HscB C-terminal domain-containing protein [Rhodoferax sp.]